MANNAESVRDDFDDLWGPSPSRLAYWRAAFWGWRRKKWHRALRHTICRWWGHSPQAFPFNDAPGEDWRCVRCWAYLTTAPIDGSGVVQ